MVNISCKRLWLKLHGFSCALVWASFQPCTAFHFLARFLSARDRQCPSISALWSNWQGVIPLFQFPPEIRKIVYTSNAIESLNMSLRKAIKPAAHFPPRKRL